MSSRSTVFSVRMVRAKAEVFSVRMGGAKAERPGEAKNANRRRAERIIVNLSMMVRVLYVCCCGVWLNTVVIFWKIQV